MSDGAGEMAFAQTDRPGETSRDAGPDPWRALVQVGARFVAALAAANDPDVLAHPWIERDPATGAKNLKMPLPPPEIRETTRQCAFGARRRLARQYCVMDSGG